MDFVYDPYECDIEGISVQDAFQCKYAHFMLAITDLPIGHLSIVLLSIIILISLFGGITEHYRWFILNQAIWDLITSYSYLCENNVLFWIKDQPSSCIYSPGEDYNFSYDKYSSAPNNPFIYYFGKFIQICVSQKSYATLLLLSFTRFLCLYFMHFYDKLTRKRRIYYMIILFNLIIMIFIAMQIYSSKLKTTSMGNWNKNCEVKLNCKKKKCTRKALDKCTQEYFGTFEYRALNILDKILWTFSFARPPICLGISLASAVMIMARIGKQMTFQLKHNRRDFLNSFRVSLVLLAQTILNSYVLFLEYLKNFFTDFYWFYLPDDGGGLDIVTDAANRYQELPFWLYDNYGIANPMAIQTFRQLRVLIEATIVLAIMTGYREAIVKTVKFIYLGLRRPRDAYRIVSNRFSSSSSRVFAFSK